jgi:RNA polymerase sigma factor (TIGR02999 family)
MISVPAMDADRRTHVTQLLARLSHGDAAAAAELLPLMYGDLHQLARDAMRGQPPGHTLQPTALVHEAWLRLAGGAQGAEWSDRKHFVAVAARAMRAVLVDHARRKQAEKRGGGRERVPLDDVADLFEERVPDVLALDEALARLGAMDEELGRLVELRFFAGLSVEETARALDVSEPTVVRGWRVARAWLSRELE